MGLSDFDRGAGDGGDGRGRQKAAKDKNFSVKGKTTTNAYLARMIPLLYSQRLSRFFPTPSARSVVRLSCRVMMEGRRRRVVCEGEEEGGM
jgi:hypothetical protein